MNRPIEVIEDAPVCGWCRKPIAQESLADHAFSCSAGPVTAVLEELTDALKGAYHVSSAFQLPKPVQTAWEVGIKQARSRVGRKIEEARRGPQS